jgi:hypothetical protein
MLYPGSTNSLEADEKVLFNHKVHKAGAKYTKLKVNISGLCDLCVILCELTLSLSKGVVNGFQSFSI